jgi:hypothetical protein
MTATRHLFNVEGVATIDGHVSTGYSILVFVGRLELWLFELDVVNLFSDHDVYVVAKRARVVFTTADS